MSVTKEEVAELIASALQEHSEATTKAMAEIANKAASSQFGRHLEKTLPELIRSTVDASLADVLPKPGDGDKTPGDKSGDPVTKELQEMKARLERAEREREEERARNNQIEAKRLRDEERSELASALRRNGVTDERRASAAMALLYSEMGRVVRDKEGAIKFVQPQEGYTDHVDLEKGVKDWLSSDDGKIFLPSTPTGGSGSGSVGSGGAPARSGYKPRDKREEWADGVLKEFGMDPSRFTKPSE